MESDQFKSIKSRNKRYHKLTEEVEALHERIKALLITQKMLRQTNSNLEYLYDKVRGVL